jgi:hypothetical protein
LRKVLVGYYRTSILSGALFFLSASMPGQDTVSVADPNVTPSADSTALVMNKPDTVTGGKPDSLYVKSDSTEKKPKKEWNPDPQRATILSAVLPGLGQAYNRKYWKIPIIYTAGGVLYYYYDLNHKAYLENKRYYEEEIAENGGNENSAKANEYRNNYQNYRKKRDYKVILMSMLYVATIVDAMADAYFMSYDISDDLSLKITPSLLPDTYLAVSQFSYGIKLSFQF